MTLLRDFHDAILTRNVVARVADTSEPSFWEKAQADLKKFNSLYAPVEKKPGDKATLVKCVAGVQKLINIAVWATKCLTPEMDAKFLTVRRALSKLSKEKDGAPEDALSDVIQQYRKVLQEAVDSTAPEHFSYEGLKVDNGQHFSDEMCRRVLSGLDYLKALFKKRGVDASLLKDAISSINLVLDESNGSAYFDSRSHVLTMSVPVMLKQTAGRFVESASGETVLHEFGHFIHLNYINGAAAEVWNEPWAGVADLADPRNRGQRDDPERKKKLDDLEVVTDYGKTNEREDFAETFMIFMAAPEKLTPTAKYRMQRALSLSGLYGKAVMRLATGEETAMGNPVDDFKDALLVANVVAKVAGPVVPFRPKPGVPTLLMFGRKYVLSTDGGPLGDRDDDGDMGWMGRSDGEGGGAKLISPPQDANKWRYLWAYDTDRQYLYMWRVSGGEMKYDGPARSEQARIVKLEKKGQLNRVTNEEYRRIETEMSKRMDDTARDMLRFVEDSKDDNIKLADKFTREFFDKFVEPKLQRALDQVERGIVPMGFKPHGPGETDPAWKLRQMSSYVLGQVFEKEMPVSKVEDYLRTKGVNVEEAGQWVDFAVGDIRDEAGETLLPSRP